MDHKNLADRYSLELIPWSRALEALESAQARTQTPFLATTRPDGRPHVAAVGALWDEGKVYFTSGSGTRKSRNLAQTANCVISMSLPGIGRQVDGRPDSPAPGEALRRPGLASDRQGRRLHL